MGKEKLIPIIALGIILISSVSSVYVYANQVNSDHIDINGTEYTISQIFFICKQKTIESNSELFTGVSLDDLMIKTGISNPEKHEYMIIASDNYQKTVKWENMKNGIITAEGRSIFSDLPKAFRVKNIAKIEVI